MCCNDELFIEKVNCKYTYELASSNNKSPFDTMANLPNPQYPIIPAPKLAPTQLHSSHCSFSNSSSVAC